MKNIYVITGAPGSGKTTLLNALRARGFKCSDEVGREIIAEQLSIGGNILPWVDLVSFGHVLLEKRLKQYLEATEELHFFDRGIPDIMGYLVADNKPIHDSLHHAAKNCCYNKIIFFAEPWEAIYKKDSERKESFDAAVKASNALKRVYSDLGYEVKTLPKASVEERVEFILRHIKK